MAAILQYQQFTSHHNIMNETVPFLFQQTDDNTGLGRSWDTEAVARTPECEGRKLQPAPANLLDRHRDYP
jgi:hypothetical protein